MDDDDPIAVRASKEAIMFLGSHPSIVKGNFQPTIDALTKAMVRLQTEAIAGAQRRIDDLEKLLNASLDEAALMNIRIGELSDEIAMEGGIRIPKSYTTEPSITVDERKD